MLVALRNRVAVVTGASQGIGEAIVRRLAAEGMRVAGLDMREEKLAELENDLKGKGHTVKGYICDVQRETDVKAAFKSIEEDFGAVTVLVNNAGVFQPTSLTDIDLGPINDILNTNVVGLLSCTREGIASMTKHSVDHGHIVNINSITGHRETYVPKLSVYCASKRAITSLNDSLRNELAPKIRVTSISPSMVKTTMTTSIRSTYPEETPFLLPSDVADAVQYAIRSPLRVNVSEIILDVTAVTTFH